MTLAAVQPEAVGVGPDHVLAAIGDATPGAALELGCGAGEVAVALAQRGWQVTALDWDRRALEAAEEAGDYFGVVVDWREGDLLRWVPQKRYRLVVLSLALPIGAVAPAIANAVSALQERGLLVVVVWDSPELDDARRVLAKSGLAPAQVRLVAVPVP